MTLLQFLQKHRLDHSLLLGFYGGGNYGDELLMEVLAGLLKQQGTQDVTIAYQNVAHYATFHHDFGFNRVDMHRPFRLLRTIFSKKTVVVGGGGLWGMDVNSNILLMGVMLLGARWVLRKKIYLLAVGFYNSTSVLGRLSAWLSAKAAHCIIARDAETFYNFSRYQKNTYQDSDIAWYAPQLDLSTYAPDVAALEKRLPLSGKTVFITLRRFRGNDRHHLAAVVGSYLNQNADKAVIVALMEPQHIDPEGYGLLQAWQRAHPALTIIDFSFNPLALFVWFRKHHQNLVFVGPQFHAILSAHLTGVPYLPLAYDNKVRNLLQQIAPHLQTIGLPALELNHVKRFIDQAFVGTR